MLGTGLLGRLLAARAEPVSTMDGYERWAPVYPAKPHNPLMEAEAAIVAPMIAAAAPRRALDIGTGTGRNLELLKSAGAASVTGIDLSSRMLSYGSGRFPRVRGDAQKLPFKAGSFDLVSSSLMCGDVPHLADWIGEAARVLARGGHLVYSDFHPSWARAGWRRTFTAHDGRTYELPFFPHTIENHIAVLERHRFDIRAIREPKIPGRATPVVVVLHATKPSFRGR
jgi:ubiquinone/menaquinone biosynthesis C-methylase UbiE